MQARNSLILLMIAYSAISAASVRAEVTTVPQVDLTRYLGTWYEVASIPQFFQRQCVGDTRAEYSLAEKGRIRVLNSCATQGGARAVAEGRAVSVDPTNAKLKVTFLRFLDWLFTFGGNYWILDLAPDYSYALIGDPYAQYAWILSRSPSVPATLFEASEKKFRAEGYDTCKILTSIQTGGNSRRVPLCQFASASGQ